MSAMLFALVAVIANMMADVHDRNFPDRLDTASSLYLDFSRSGIDDPTAFASVMDQSARLDIEVFKVQPNLNGDKQAQNLVRLGPGGPKDGTEINWYGDQPSATIANPTVLEHSFATGAYLVAGSAARLDDFTAQLADDGVLVKREDDTVWQTAEFVLRQGTFRTALLAVITLMTSMALFWLSIRARGRALRVLGGVASSRILFQDLGAFLAAVLAAAIPVAVVASVSVGLTHGWEFVPYYAKCLGVMQAVLAALTVAIALGISCVSWPSALLLARREPPVQSLRRASVVLKAVTFLLVIAAAGPAWLSYRDASEVAAQQARWKALADQVALRYPAGLGESGFVSIRDRVGRAVDAADRSGNVALSYAMTPEQVGVPGFGSYGTFALVNARWLTLMGDDKGRGTRPIPLEDLPTGLANSLKESLAVWTAGQGPVPALDTFEFLAADGAEPLPLAEGGSGDLIFKDRALLMVVKDVATFNADFLSSLTSSSNLVFQGLESTIGMLRAVGLEQTVRVVHVAEDGILRAQYTAYMAWLRVIAMIALILAFIIAASVSALVAAMLSSRRDFPLRLSGRSWTSILSPRLARESLVGLALAAGIVLVQPPDTALAVLLAAAAGLVIAPGLHYLATRWCFTNVSLRRS